MTREIAKRKIEMLDSYLQRKADYGERDHEAMMMASKALEQEPILEKLRAEIQNGVHHFLDGEPIIEIKEVLQIIDKYKAESEE